MKQVIIITLIVLTVSHSQAGWFSRNTEREQRLQAEERLRHAEEQVQSQQKTILQLYTHSSAFAAGAVILLIVGIGLGAKVKRDESRK